ncbi:GGDEF domain-containing protein [Lamprobacter modestohalophilus]|uniref:GGDEF domain-containing protein n=1 Tax=Lamprobacter modestohalophilus TaxID=1064514 RepID=UPI002ADEE829|nr:GGDEF domain-containing protein [Lamprobacter modestohalophilus]MEA1048769.1 GGDEF domain-containing protein [Lamprobacter modestohalophilus]
MNIKHRGQIYNIYVVVGLSSLLLISSFYFFGLRPLIEYLRATHTQSLELAVQNSAGRLQGILRHHEDLARQAASRTAIRLKQAAYLRGEINREALVDFSQPKLADALRANDLMLAITRHGPDGDRLFGVGRPVPVALTAACMDDALEQVQRLSNEVAKRTGALVYCSPLFESSGERIGFDTLIISDQAVQQFIDEQSRPASLLALVSGERQIKYWPRQTTTDQPPADQAATEQPTTDQVPAEEPPNDQALTEQAPTDQAQTALRQFLASGSSDPRFIIRQQPLEGDLWSLVSIVDAEQFYAPIDQQIQVLLATTAGATLVVYLLTVLALRPIVSTLAREEHLLSLSRTDGLTGLYNHAYMQELIDTELERARRYQRPLTLVLFDIDHFKALNDQHGHQAGDQVLMQLAKLCQTLIRDSDRIARYGGEEFLIILPELEPEQSQQFAERLRHEIEQARFRFGETPLRITMSIGLAHWNGQDTPPTKIELIRAADRALYKSKEQGRNRVTQG